MAKPIVVDIPHELGRAEAHRRIDSGFARILELLPGGATISSARWDGDRFVFRIAAMGQTIDGVIHVLETLVTMEIELPGVLGLIAGGLKGRLQRVGRTLLTK